MTFDFYKFTAQVACVFVFWFCAFAFIMNDGKEWGQEFQRHGNGRPGGGGINSGSSRRYPGSVVQNSVEMNPTTFKETGRRDLPPEVNLEEIGRRILPVPRNTELNLNRREQDEQETIRMFKEAEEMSFLFLPYEARPRRSKHYSHPYLGGQYVVQRHQE